MDGAKPSFIPPSEIYIAIGTARCHWLSTRHVTVFDTDHRMIIGAVRCPPCYIALRHVIGTESQPVRTCGPARIEQMLRRLRPIRDGEPELHGSHQYFGRCDTAHLRACSMGPTGG
jgi:hypothetical protein